MDPHLVEQTCDEAHLQCICSWHAEHRSVPDSLKKNHSDAESTPCSSVCGEPKFQWRLIRGLANGGRRPTVKDSPGEQGPPPPASVWIPRRNDATPAAGANALCIDTTTSLSFSSCSLSTSSRTFFRSEEFPSGSSAGWLSLSLSLSL